MVDVGPFYVASIVECLGTKALIADEMMRGIVRQLSMLPVGHGGTQAMQKLHLSASTTET